LDHTKLAKTLGRNPSRIEAKTMPGAKRLRRTLGDLAFKVEWIDLRRVQAPSEFLGVLLCTDGVWTECELQELVTECVAARGYSAAEEIVTTALTRDPTDDCAVAIAMRADPEEGLLEHLAQQAMSAPRPL
jgi:serine/threonine protein phosphatase PrpC